MWMDKANYERGHEIYHETMNALCNALANINGKWVLEAAVTVEDSDMFYLMAADHAMDWYEVEWQGGLSVTCAVRYGSGSEEKEIVCEMMATFQTDEGEDHKKELELLIAMLKAWVEEKVFPNARMAVNVRELLGVEDIQDILAELNFPAYVRSSSYHYHI